MSSDYYPPRARWHGRLRYPLARWRRRLGLHALSLRAGMRLGPLALCLLVPGYSFFVLGRHFFGAALLLIYLIAGGTFAIGLDLPAVDVPGPFLTYRFEPEYLAFGLMIAIHSISVFRLFARRLGDMDRASRVLLALAVTVFFACCVYWPLLRLARKCWPALPADTTQAIPWGKRLVNLQGLGYIRGCRSTARPVLAAAQNAIVPLTPNKCRVTSTASNNDWHPAMT